MLLCYISLCNSKLSKTCENVIGACADGVGQDKPTHQSSLNRTVCRLIRAIESRVTVKYIHENSFFEVSWD